MFSDSTESDAESPRDLDRLSKRDWVLLLLYAPDGLGVSAAVRGEFSLSLGLFLVSVEAHGVSVSGPFDFEKSKRGPFDASLADEVDSLVREGYIHKQPISAEAGEGLNDAKYDITSKGETHVRQIFQKLPDGQRNAIEDVKQDFLLDSTSNLILETLRHGDQYFCGNLIRR